MRWYGLGCDARRGAEAMLDASRGAVTRQRAQSVPALRVASKCGARFVACLGKGSPLPAARFARSSAFGCNAYRSSY